jgi:ribosome biogenesis GTPase
VSTFSTERLVPYGWSDRVLALYSAATDTAPERIGRDESVLLPARVTRVERSGCFAVLPDGDEYLLTGDPLPAVGDWITTAAGVVAHVLPRWSEVTRIDPAGNGLQILAANVDAVAVVAPADHVNPARVERELALASDCGAVPVVVVTKADLDGDGNVAATLRARIPDVEVLVISAVDQTGFDGLRAILTPHRTCMFLGPSGAGKSTLANALLGDERLDTGATRLGDGRGRHTTTSRQLVVIPSGGVIIDTPGIRSLALPADVELDRGFADITALASGCRFSDCRHDQEPGCAVQRAVRDGTLDPGRLANLSKLAREAMFQQSRQDPLLRRENRQLWRARTKQNRAAAKRRDQ